MPDMKFILGLILLTQVGCSFITTAAGSFVGNFSSYLVEEKIKENKIDKMFKDDMEIDKCQKDCT